jgi:hypothetical protein
VDSQCAAAPAFETKAFELFGLPTASPRPTGILVVHGHVVDLSGPWSVLNTVVDHNEQHGKKMRAWIEDALPSCATVYPPHRRAEHITLITFDSTRMASLPGLNDADRKYLADAWLGYLANSGRIVPDVEMIESVGKLIGMSASLRGLVSKAGIALVGLREDTGRSDGSQGFDYGGAEFFVEGLYSDAMLLAQLQRYRVRELREKLNDARTSGGKAQQLVALEQELITFRVTYWRTDFAPQGSQDDFLSAYHNVNGVVAELEEVHNQISEYSDQVQRGQQQLTNAVLGVLTVLAFPLGTAVAIWSGISKHTIGELLLALAIGVTIAALTLLLPGTRALLAALLPRNVGK